jgi:hypothetical protein
VVRKIVFWAAGLCLAAAGAAVILYKPPAPPPKPKLSDHFVAAKDKAFVDLTSGKLAKRFDAPDDVVFWDPVVSRMPNGAESLCVDAHGPDQAWSGMIAAHDKDAAGFMIYRGGDTLSAKIRAQCRAIIRRVIQNPGTASAPAMAEYDQVGCADRLDRRYVYAYVRYCTGAETRPAPSRSTPEGKR